MSAVCPSGHVSATSDYCDQCGAPIGSASLPPPSEAVPLLEEVDTSTSVRHQPCPACRAPRSGDDRYCEGCGYDFANPPPSVASPAEAAAAGERADGSVSAAWVALARANQRQFERNANTGIAFPSDYPERCFALLQPEIRIGRSRGRPGEQIPEIDLAGTPEDPGISRLHAVLERQPDGTYALRDLGSTNGTTVNDDATPIAGQTAVPLLDGDCIRLGAWTTIQLRKR
jgi:hypothetical protein